MSEKWITVFASSSDALNDSYFELGIQLGKRLAKTGYNLVYGGSRVGLMGKVAETVKKYGGKVVGVIPRRIHKNVPPLDIIDELVITDSMHERKAEMALRGDAFIALPGGFGTLEEILEIITQKQLKYHDKAIVFLNYQGFFDLLFQQFEHFFDNNFAKLAYHKLYKIVSTPTAALDYIRTYKPPQLEDKWYDTKSGFKST